MSPNPNVRDGHSIYDLRFTILKNVRSVSIVCSCNTFCAFCASLRFREDTVEPYPVRHPQKGRSKRCFWCRMVVKARQVKNKSGLNSQFVGDDRLSRNSFLLTIVSRRFTNYAHFSNCQSIARDCAGIFVIRMLHHNYARTVARCRIRNDTFTVRYAGGFH